MLTMRDGSQAIDGRFGRIKEVDPVALDKYALRKLIAPVRSPLRSYRWAVGANNWYQPQVHLNQRQLSGCVGFSFSHELAAKPVIVRGVTDDSATELYFDIQDEDQWDGSERPGAVPQMYGTSVIAGARLLQRRGHYKSFAWAENAKDAAWWISRRGPVVFGMDWHEGMMDTDDDGFIRRTGRIVGGHAICGVGYSVKLNAVLLHQSWGALWGMGGQCWISLDDLWNEGTEACVPTRTPFREMIVNG